MEARTRKFWISRIHACAIGMIMTKTVNLNIYIAVPIAPFDGGGWLIYIYISYYYIIRYIYIYTNGAVVFASWYNKT